MVKEKAQKDRIIALVTGDSGSGKSFFVANLKDAIIFDTDLGGGLGYADERIAKNGSERVEASSYKEILDILRDRVRTKTLKTTVCIDHITGLHQEAILRHNPNQEADYGRSSARATAEWRRIREFVRALDCNLICTAHLKGEWAGNAEIGKTTDGAKNVEADMGIVLYLSHKKGGGYPAKATVIKWRRDPEDPRGLVPSEFPFTVDEFAKIGGATFTRKREAVELASAEQVAEFKHLTTVIKFEEDEVEKWLRKVGVASVEDAPANSLGKFIVWAKEKVSGKEIK